MDLDSENDGPTARIHAARDALSAIEPFLACPACRVPLRRDGDELSGVGGT